MLLGPVVFRTCFSNRNKCLVCWGRYSVARVVVKSIFSAAGRCTAGSAQNETTELIFVVLKENVTQCSLICFINGERNKIYQTILVPLINSLFCFFVFLWKLFTKRKKHIGGERVRYSKGFEWSVTGSRTVMDNHRGKYRWMIGWSTVQPQ